MYGILLRRGYDDDQLKRKFRDLMRGRPDILHRYNVQDINDIPDLVFKSDIIYRCGDRNSLLTYYISSPKVILHREDYYYYY